MISSPVIEDAVTSPSRDTPFSVKTSLRPRPVDVTFSQFDALA